MGKKELDYRNVLGEPATRLEVLAEIEKDESLYESFRGFPEYLKEELIAFCMGNRGLKITYDPFFKFVFHPELKPKRLSEVLTLILKEEVEVVKVMPNESDRISEKGSLLVMDILVKLKSGAYANVEVQKIGYNFQGERAACYSSDLLMRQLSRERAEAKESERRFSYRSLKKVYTIIFMEQSPAEYWKYPGKYIHHAKQVFDTGLRLDLLQEYFMIPLDVFREMPHNELSKLEAWLYFIGSDEPKDIYRVIEAFPEFKEYYNELLMLRYRKRELIDMYDIYREALREADEGTVLYMIEEREEQIEEQKRILEEQKQEIEGQKQEIEGQKQEIEEQKQEIEEQKRILEEQKKQIEEQKRENARLKVLLGQVDVKLE